MKITLAIILFSFSIFAQNTMNFGVEGMDCPFCASKVEKELKKIKGVKGLDIDMDKEILKVEVPDKSPPSPGEIIKAISEAGFKAKSLN